jgi:hypothetical protein
MLRESLRVVEAARQLKLTMKDGRTVADIRNPVELAFAIESLRRSLESFDESTGKGRGRPRSGARPDFATPPQMNDDGFTADMAAIDGEISEELIDDMIEGEALEEELEAIEEEERNKARNDVIAAISAASPVMFPLRAGLRPSDIPDDAIDGVFVSDDTVEQLEMGLDMIEDRLGFAVRKAGWSYRLKGLAEAAIQAMGSLDLLVDQEREETWVAMPAQSFSDLMKHVTDVSVNHDLKIELPVPTAVQRENLSPRGVSDIDLDDVVESMDDQDMSPFDAAM